VSKNKIPIIIILYNRPKHTEKLLQSITSGKNFCKYDFYVFCDGPRNKEDAKKIKKIKILINQFKKKTRVKTYFRNKNIGLIKNITNSINLILKKNDKAIILEDDLILDYDFFNFMKKALTTYANHNKIFQVSGYSYPIKKNNNSHYFLALTSCWGWGISVNNWKNFIDFLNDKKLINYYYQKLRNSKSLRHRFNYNGSYNYFSMLEKTLNNKVNSWGIIFYLYLFINKKLTLFPNQSLVKNNGFDGSGNHQSKSNYFNKEFKIINSGNFPKKVLNCELSKNKIENFFKNNLTLYGKIKNKFYEKFF
tara:strand:+ start:4454 stop:5374 length:921 start_codon:yes stop_codon:yes gene_type:complete